MFKYTIDNKDKFVNEDGVEMVDLTSSIFKDKGTGSIIYSIYKNNSESKMRPDKISMSIYGTDEYTEMVMKYSMIDNPFALDENDMLLIPSLTTVYNETNTVNTRGNRGDTYEALKAYHKYIDKTKVPENAGSDKVSDVYAEPNTKDTISPEAGKGTKTGNMEPNMANNGKSGITVQNGRIFFGPTVSADASDITDVDGTNKTDSDIVDCAKNGVTLGQFLDATIKNSI